MSLYREFRPLDFNNVVGQEDNTNILKEQIRNKNFTHAYLFVGTHGTGKTSSAKIMSRAVNCEHPTHDGNPCNECETCKSILDGSSLDVTEIDAASNNGVANIRELIENCSYVPYKSKYKVYIIDEVHMLSMGAFNALLKTLEEPPKHCVLILCTTELHKVPATIRSRCQIFNFKHVKAEAMIKRMQYVCGEIGVVADSDALALICNNSNGAMRDALSILDQCTSLTNRVTEDIVRRTLGIMDQSIIYTAVETILNHDVAGALSTLSIIVSQGLSLFQYVDYLISMLRDIMIVKTTNDISSIDNTEEYCKTVDRLKDLSTIENIVRLINELSDLKIKMGRDIYPKTRVEAVLVKICFPIYANTYDDLISQITELRKELDNIKQSGKIIEIEKHIEIVTAMTGSISLEEAFNKEPNKDIVVYCKIKVQQVAT